MKTVVNYRTHVRDVWKPRLGHLRLRDVRRGHIEQVIAELAEPIRGDRRSGNIGRRVTRRSAATVESYRKTIRAAFSAAVRAELVASDPALGHLYFDISWDEVAKYAVATPESIQRVASVLNKYPDRVLFGTDTVAPAGPEPYYRVFDMWAPVWKLLTPEASLKVRKGNYERIFDEGRRRVRAWEKANVH